MPFDGALEVIMGAWAAQDSENLGALRSQVGVPRRAGSDSDSDSDEAARVRWPCGLFSPERAAQQQALRQTAAW